MPDRKVLERIKSATVAIAMQSPGPLDPRQHPFRIVGTGFCISSDGIVITCEHVIAAFSRVNPREAIAALPKQTDPSAIVPVPGMVATRPTVPSIGSPPASPSAGGARRSRRDERPTRAARSPRW